MRINGFLLGLGLTTLAAGAALAENSIGSEGLKATPTSVTIGAVSSTKAGYVVVHQDVNGKPGPIVGHASVKAGSNSGVTVTLDKKEKAGTKLIVMLHEESDNDNKFDKKDKPAISGGKIVEQLVTVQ
ncbi:MAG: hypothetical protein WC807_01455 [Hyphomicrobium sp.]|jgi:hypothetical protein